MDSQKEMIPDRILSHGQATSWRYNAPQLNNGDSVPPDGGSLYVARRNSFGTCHETLDSIAADIPGLLNEIRKDPEIVKSLELSYVDTSTVQYHGPRDDEFSYEVSHRSPGPFSTGKDIERSLGNGPVRRYMKVGPSAWADLGRGKYLEEDITRIHLEDVKRGDVPVNAPYTVFARENEVNDLPPIMKERDVFVSGYNYDGFIKSDYALMTAGSPENVETLAQIYFQNSDGLIDHNLNIEGPQPRRSSYVIGNRRSPELRTLPAVAGMSRIYLASRSIPEPYSPDLGLDGSEMRFVGIKERRTDPGPLL